jgi:hypothetical protein
MKVTIDVPDELIRDQLTSGIEQGIHYWCSEVRGWTGYDRFKVTDRVKVKDEAGKWHMLDFERAVQLAARLYPRVLDTNEQDAGTGDLFIQLAAFGDIVYG